MNSITVTVNLSEETRARLDKIIEALVDLKAPQAPTSVIREPIDTPEDRDAPQTATTEPEQPEPAPQPEPIPGLEEPAPQHTRAELQHLVVTLTSAGKKAEVRAIVLAVAPKVSDIPEDKLDDVYEQLKALEG